MKNILIIAFLGVAGLGFGQHSEKNFIDQNFIEVTGKSEMQLIPDLIYLKIVISEKDTKNKISVAEMEKKMTDKFREIGIDIKKDLVIKDLLSYYKSKFIAKADVILSKEYQLEVHDGKTAARVFEELEKIDISNVSIDHVDHTKMEEFRKETKVNAIKAARDKAESLTKAIGQSIGRAIYISELNNDSSGPSNSMHGLAVYRDSDGESKPVVDLDFEKIKLEYSIFARFELK